MTTERNIYELPTNLPAPQDDGACSHLLGMKLPDTSLTATSGQKINLSTIHNKWLVVYCYPMTGAPGIPLPLNWDEIPGARGCTPQSCAFRDLYDEFQRENAVVYGLSTQSTDYQREAKERLHLPFELLSDASLGFAHALKLPTFQVESKVLLKRVTIIAQDGLIKKVFYPIFPPTTNPSETLEWIKNESH